jgi:hypothetical protein
MCADEDGAELLEVTMFFILNLGNTPGVLATLYSAPIICLNVLLRADDGEWHGCNEAASMLEASLVIFLERRLIDLDTLSFNDGTYLGGSLASIS